MNSFYTLERSTVISKRHNIFIRMNISSPLSGNVKMSQQNRGNSTVLLQRQIVASLGPAKSQTMQVLRTTTQQP